MHVKDFRGGNYGGLNVSCRRTGICFYFLAAKGVPIADRKQNWVQRLIGTTILLSAEGEAVITVYRNKNQKALHNIKRKAKYRIVR